MKINSTHLLVNFQIIHMRSYRNKYDIFNLDKLTDTSLPLNTHENMHVFQNKE